MGTTARRVRRVVMLSVLLAGAPAGGWAQPVRGVVVDQTDLPLPGVTIQLMDGASVVRTLQTGADGSFLLDPTLPGDAVLASLEGFEPTRIARTQAARIVLAIARATETTTVVGAGLADSEPTAPALGSTLTAATVASLPSAHMKARDSLPLLPSVVRGADGLLQLGGARAYQTPLTLDGFNVTDPATGLSSMNLPFEAVRSIDAIRDPMAVSYGGLMGGLVRLDSKAGGDEVAAGVQGFIPRPRFGTPGFGRLEAIFPRAYVSGPAAGGRVQYTVAGEIDYERIPVPDVTNRNGIDLVEQSAILFSRVDAQMTPRQTLSLEGFWFPASTQRFGLSPRRDASATVDLSSVDFFAGVTHRFLSDDAGLFTIQIGAFVRDADAVPIGSGPSVLSPASWSGRWFSTVTRSAKRYTTTASWERVVTMSGRTHDVTLTGEVAARRLAGRIDERAVVVINADGAPVRSVDFGPAAAFNIRDVPVGLAGRDVWAVTERLQIDAGVRLDHSRYGGGAPSARAGLRYVLDRSNRTVLKAGYGEFIGSLPLSIPAFGGYPGRIDRWLDAESGAVVHEAAYRPTVGALRLPRAVAAVVGVEREVAPGLEAQVFVTSRRSSRIATLNVPAGSGELNVDSTGSGGYRELQLAARRTWSHGQQLFVSYVRSSAEGELNEFAALFQTMDAPLLQPGGRAAAPSDARNRVLAWGTVNLPARVVLSPVTEWRSGFPYSALTERYLYDGLPQTGAFPTFIAVDLLAYKTFSVKRRSADLGIQVFNLTNHENPREVYPVTDSWRGGQFANSVGTIVRGYMLVKW